MDTTSPRAPFTMSVMVGAMISLTTLCEKKLSAALMSRCSISGRVSGPNNGAM